MTVGMIDEAVKEIIFEFRTKNPDVGFYKLSKIFGLSIHIILEIFDFSDVRFNKVYSENESLLIKFSKYVEYEEYKNLDGNGKIYTYDYKGEIKKIELVGYDIINF